ncbi:MAG: sulfatase, partial [Verrucomicrobiales bacterium]|nr:sulfatase [Verrucomicrobiales bacterium]
MMKPKFFRFALALLVGLALSVGTQLQSAEKPNVLWIYLEDVSGWFSCYGDKIIKTPNIDALA